MKIAMHVHGPSMQRNHATGANHPVVCIRPADDLELAVIVREAFIVGPSSFVHRPGQPLPNTDGRAVSWVETDSPVWISTDDYPEARVLTLDLVAKYGKRGF